ncbi:MAG: bifunctional nuclease family protein [Verrucomicrobia bacterium]|nr:bifunctional nuclease family protein [Verrucomicrobiota bacterium]MBS0645824.1 bifunctional nuclease family protein [Verrucomicrobiota bacterium]
MDETLTIVPLQFEKVVQSRTYSCIVLASDEKKFGIFSLPETGKAMQRYLTESQKERPLTHDLLHAVFRGLDMKVKQIVIVDLQDTVYYARLFLEQKLTDRINIIEIDARPSDCVTLALIYKSPIYCTRDVLEKAIPYCD